jgi:hypothetical protein
MTEWIVINGHAPWCAYIRALHSIVVNDDCDCAGWDDDDPCHCGAWDPVENAHTKAEHTECGGYLHGDELPCGGCDDCISAQVSYYGRKAIDKEIERGRPRLVDGGIVSADTPLVARKDKSP